MATGGYRQGRCTFTAACSDTSRESVVSVETNLILGTVAAS